MKKLKLSALFLTSIPALTVALPLASCGQNNVTLKSIEVTQPTRTEYFVGEKLVLDGMVVYAVYSNGTKEQVKEGYKVTPSPDQALKLTDTTVTVEYKEKTAKFNIKINEAPIGIKTINAIYKGSTHKENAILSYDTLEVNGLYSNQQMKTLRKGEFKIYENENGKLTDITTSLDNGYSLNAVKTYQFVVESTENNKVKNSFSVTITESPTDIKSISVTYKGKTTTDLATINKDTITVIGTFTKSESRHLLPSEYKVYISEGGADYKDITAYITTTDGYRLKTPTGYKIKVSWAANEQIYKELEFAIISPTISSIEATYSGKLTLDLAVLNHDVLNVEITYDSGTKQILKQGEYKVFETNEEGAETTEITSQLVAGYKLSEAKTYNFIVKPTAKETIKTLLTIAITSPIVKSITATYSGTKFTDFAILKHENVKVDASFETGSTRQLNANEYKVFETNAEGKEGAEITSQLTDGYKLSTAKTYKFIFKAVSKLEVTYTLEIAIEQTVLSTISVQYTGSHSLPNAIFSKDTLTVKAKYNSGTEKDLAIDTEYKVFEANEQYVASKDITSQVSTGIKYTEAKKYYYVIKATEKLDVTSNLEMHITPETITEIIPTYSGKEYTDNAILSYTTLNVKGKFDDQTTRDLAKGEFSVLLKDGTTEKDITSLLEAGYALNIAKTYNFIIKSTKIQTVQKTLNIDISQAIIQTITIKYIGKTSISNAVLSYANLKVTGTFNSGTTRDLTSSEYKVYNSDPQGTKGAEISSDDLTTGIKLQTEDYYWYIIESVATPLVSQRLCVYVTQPILTSIKAEYTGENTVGDAVLSYSTLKVTGTYDDDPTIKPVENFDFKVYQKDDSGAETEIESIQLTQGINLSAARTYNYVVKSVNDATIKSDLSIVIAAKTFNISCTKTLNDPIHGFNGTTLQDNISSADKVIFFKSDSKDGTLCGETDWDKVYAKYDDVKSELLIWAKDKIVFDDNDFARSGSTWGLFLTSSVREIDLANTDFSKVTNMGYMFALCTNLTKITNFNTLDTSSAKNMECMFYMTPALSDADFSKFDTSKVTNMESMFSYTSIKNLDLSSFNTSNVSKMYYMFAFANTETIDISSFDMKKVRNVAYMFNDLRKLKTIYGDDYLNKYNSDVVYTYMIRNCPNLKGGNGTKFDSGWETGLKHAHVDYTNYPGYFTTKHPVVKENWTKHYIGDSNDHDYIIAPSFKDGIDKSYHIEPSLVQVSTGSNLSCNERLILQQFSVPVVVPANTTNYKVEISLKGKMTYHLNGFFLGTKFRACAEVFNQGTNPNTNAVSKVTNYFSKSDPGDPLSAGHEKFETSTEWSSLDSTHDLDFTLTYILSNTTSAPVEQKCYFTISWLINGQASSRNGNTNGSLEFKPVWKYK